MAAIMAPVPQGAKVRNTFIDFPTTPAASPLPSPMASAPARSAFSVKDSLAEAASDFQEIQSGGLRRRMKPDPLGAIPEGPVSMVVTQTPMTQVRRESGKVIITGPGPVSSIPPTPVATWEVMATPSGSPVANLRQTLSLVDMVQSPTADAKMVLWQSAYTHFYQMPGVGQVVQAAPPQYQAAPASSMAVPAGTMTLVAAAPQTLVAGSAPVTASVAAPVAAPISAPISAQPVAPHEVRTQVAGPPAGAAARLGLVEAWQTNPPPMAPPQVTVSAAPAPLSPPPLAPAPITVTSVHSQQQPNWPPPPPMMAPQLSTVTAVAPQPQPPVQTAVVAPPAPPRFVPPPPLAPAPMLLSSPKATMPAPSLPAGSGMVESDMRVLLDLAVASRNQQAVDALLRQAQQAGIPQERFHAMLNAASGAHR